MGQFFNNSSADRSFGGAKQGPWRRDLARTWRAALDLPEAPDGATSGDLGDDSPEPLPGPATPGERAGPV